MNNLEILKFTTCQEYRDYMSGTPDNIKTQEHNPVPQDAMSLSEFGKLPIKDLVERINAISQTENKSDIRVMYCNGYGFTWGEMVVVAKFLNLECNYSKGKKKPLFSLSEASNGYDNIPTSLSIYIDRGRRQNPVTRKLTLEETTNQKIEQLLTDSNGESLAPTVASKVFEKFLNKHLDEALEMKRQGNLKVYYSPLAAEQIA